MTQESVWIATIDHTATRERTIAALQRQWGEPIRAAACRDNVTRQVVKCRSPPGSPPV